VRRYAAQKQAALKAHGPPGGRISRLAHLLVRLPVPAYGLFFGREWFAEPSRCGPAAAQDATNQGMTNMQNGWPSKSA
jgi:hypothetical protein